MSTPRRIPRSLVGAGVLSLAAVVGFGLGVGIARALPGSGAAGSDARSANPAPTYVEEAAAAGVDHAYDGEFDFVVGGGVATFDCDDDLRPDLFIAGGANPAALFRNRSDPGGALRFERAGSTSTDLDAVTGAYPLDIDGDRVTDLAVLRQGEDVVLRGLGDCAFERANERFGIDGADTWTVGFSATWESPMAALPTLAFGDYLELDDAGEWAGTCADGRFIRPAATADRYGPAIPLAPSWCSLSMLFSDWDRSGRRDLRVSNDRHYYREGEEQLWRVEPGRPPRLYAREDGWQPLRIWGMGIASEDVTGDGYPEVYLTSQGDNKLQTLAEGPAAPRYTDIALRRGATAHRPYAGGDEALPSTAWHPQFEDVNNDGFIDLFVSKGNVEAQTDFATKDPSNLLIGQPDGTFTEGAPDAGLVTYERARGAAVVDLNADGLLDLVQVVRRTNVQLWRNEGVKDASSGAHWVGVDLDQAAPNHDAVGAWVAVRAGDVQREREVVIGGGHASGQLVPLHFGLGTADRAEIRVTWPGGEVGPWLPVDADGVVRVVRGAAAVEPVG